MAKLVLIDGNSILNRAFYGIMGSKMLTTKDGKYTNAVYGFLAILFKILEDIQLKEYNKLLLNIETHMSNLESLASHYKKRTDEEVNSMSLGKTLLFQTNN